MVTNAKNKERMEREKVITLLRLVKENGLKLDIAADEICSLFNVIVPFVCHNCQSKECKELTRSTSQCKKCDHLQAN